MALSRMLLLLYIICSSKRHCLSAYLKRARAILMSWKTGPLRDILFCFQNLNSDLAMVWYCLTSSFQPTIECPLCFFIGIHFLMHPYTVLTIS